MERTLTSFVVDDDEERIMSIYESRGRKRRLERPNPQSNEGLLWGTIEAMRMRMRKLKERVDQIDAPRSVQGTSLPNTHRELLEASGVEVCRFRNGTPEIKATLVLRQSFDLRDGPRRCTGFPHAVLEPRIGRGAGAPTLFCAVDQKIVLDMQLLDEKGECIGGRAMLERVNASVPYSTLRDWGYFGSELVLYTSLQLDGNSPSGDVRRLVPGKGLLPGVFVDAHVGASVFVPPEAPPYERRSSTEVCIDEKGRAIARLSLGSSIASTHLTKDFKERAYRMHVVCLHPRLTHMRLSTAPFYVKRTLRHDFSYSRLDKQCNQGVCQR